jgi:hypothetical protein
VLVLASYSRAWRDRDERQKGGVCLDGVKGGIFRKEKKDGPDGGFEVTAVQI